MKRTLLMSSFVATLMVASFAASAQTDAGQSAPAAQKSHADPKDVSKGQELVGDTQTPASVPATVGQDKATGNNLVPEKNDGQKQNAKSEHPDFHTLDSKNKGYLTAEDVASHAWLSSNFTRCNTGNDGHLTSQEYAKCLK
jgi:hypothetical protein